MADEGFASAVKRFVLTGNNHHLEGSNQLPPAARLRGLRVTLLKYGG